MRLATIPLLASLCAILATPPFPPDNWSLLPAHFQHATVSLPRIDAKHAPPTPARPAETKIPLDRILRLDRSATITPGAGKYTLLLHGGDRLGGEPLSLKDDTLTWTTSAVGEIKLPLNKVQAISRVAVPAAALEEQRKE